MTQNNALAPHERDDFEVAYAAEYQATLGATCAARDIADMREGDRYPTGLHYLNGQWKGWQARAALAAQRAADGIEAPTAVGALILGGAVSSTELGENDITLDSQVVERIQRELVKDSEDLAIELMLVDQHYRILQALRAERDAAQARVAELEKQEPVAWVDAEWIAQVSDPRGAGCTVRRAYGSAGADLSPVYAAQVAQAGQVPEELTAKINECLTLAFEEIALYVSPDKCRDPRSRARRASALATEIRAALAAAPAQGGE